MAFALAIGGGLGFLGGAALGCSLFNKKSPADYKFLAIEEEEEEGEVPPDVDKLAEQVKDMLEYTNPWTFWPDYSQASSINRVISVLWPAMSKAIMEEVIKQARGPIQDAVSKNKMLSKYIEDIVLGTASMLKPEISYTGFSANQFTIGSNPIRVGGIKSYDIKENEVVIEASVIWGSNCKFNVGVYLRLGSYRIYLPLEVSDVHLKADARITLKPLVEELPCIGGICVSLLSVPTVDLSLRLAYGCDLLALPILKDTIRLVISKVVQSMMLYPNSLDVPIMPNFGVTPPPKGMLNVKVIRCDNLKGSDYLVAKIDPFVSLEIRKKRGVRTKTVKSSRHPEFNEEFNMLVDDFDNQVLTARVFDDDFGWGQDLVGQVIIPFFEVRESINAAGEKVEVKEPPEFIKAPMQEHPLRLELLKPTKRDLERLQDDDHKEEEEEEEEVPPPPPPTATKAPGEFGGGMPLPPVMTKVAESNVVQKASSFFSRAPEPAKKVVGLLELRVTFIPFFEPKYDDDDGDESDDDDKPKVPKPKPPPKAPDNRSINQKVTERTKGVLSVKLLMCSNLVADGDVYVRFSLSDPDKLDDEVQVSRVIYNTSLPRWNDTFEFVMVSAGSYLNVEVYDKTSFLEGVFSLKIAKRFTDKFLGRLRLPLLDVATNGRIKDSWPMADTESGEVEMVMTWQTCFVSDD